MILPFFAKAQNFSMQRQQSANMQRQMSNQNAQWAMQRQRDTQQWQMHSMMSRSMNKIEIAEKKLAQEERNLEKIEKKSIEMMADLQMKQEELLILDTKSKENHDSKLTKSIEKLKEEVLRIEEKLNKTNTQLESSSKKKYHFKQELETAELEKEELTKKQEEEKKVKKEEKEKKEAKN
jgi:hypothetical protein